VGLVAGLRSERFLTDSAVLTVKFVMTADAAKSVAVILDRCLERVVAVRRISAVVPELVEGGLRGIQSGIIEHGVVPLW
jgi:hypothetical protein